MIDSLIQPNLNLRLSPFAALKHPWILKHVEMPQKNHNLLRKLLKIKKKSIFQHFNTLILSELLSRSDCDFISKVKDTFLAIEKSALGHILKVEFYSALDEVSREITWSEKQFIFDAIAFDGGGLISYSEWMSALVYAT
jgi:hypothetical protein